MRPALLLYILVRYGGLTFPTHHRYAQNAMSMSQVLPISHLLSYSMLLGTTIYQVRPSVANNSTHRSADRSLDICRDQSGLPRAPHVCVHHAPEESLPHLLPAAVPSTTRHRLDVPARERPCTRPGAPRRGAPGLRGRDGAREPGEVWARDYRRDDCAHTPG